jgi:hypothetical protein
LIIISQIPCGKPAKPASKLTLRLEQRDKHLEGQVDAPQPNPFLTVGRTPGAIDRTLLSAFESRP